MAAAAETALPLRDEQPATLLQSSSLSSITKVCRTGGGARAATALRTNLTGTSSSGELFSVSLYLKSAKLPRASTQLVERKVEINTFVVKKCAKINSFLILYFLVFDIVLMRFLALCHNFY